MRLVSLAVLSGCLFAFAPPVHADASVEKRLNERGLEFQVDEDGDYRVAYRFGDENRTQLAFVRGATETTRSFVVREVWAAAAHIERDGISGDKALELLADSRTNKLGSWELDGKVLVYVINLPDDVSAATLEAALDTVATVADEMEIRLTDGRDAY